MINLQNKQQLTGFKQQLTSFKQQLSGSRDIEDNDVLQLRSGPETEKEKRYGQEIQSRIRQAYFNSMHARVSLVAYNLWQKEGCPPQGNTMKNWTDAEKIIASETLHLSMP